MTVSYWITERAPTPQQSPIFRWATLEDAVLEEVRQWEAARVQRAVVPDRDQVEFGEAP